MSDNDSPPRVVNTLRDGGEGVCVCGGGRGGCGEGVSVDDTSLPECQRESEKEREGDRARAGETESLCVYSVSTHSRPSQLSALLRKRILFLQGACPDKDLTIQKSYKSLPSHRVCMMGRLVYNP